ncbi:MAG: NAD-dependent succinate-semialdehyde dehydrogenase [Bacteroidetes bacterium]|nr:NAD-dependent succinate-semialdehyde dehydrogenase [Bacteroidota bacterium]
MPMRSINPTTNETLAEYPELTPAEVEAKLALADRRAKAYRHTQIAERAGMMAATARLLRERRDGYAHLMTLEMGKPIAAAESEVEKCAWACDYYAENAAAMLADIPAPSDASNSRIIFQPLGVVLAVMPWNFPFWQCFRFIAPALMAGNVGLLKHASNVPGCALAIEEVLHDAGFPEGCFQTLLIGSHAVADVIHDARVAAATLTGSEGAGRSVGAAAGRSLKKVVLELGGSDPFIIMPSADLDAAATTAVTARTINNGQSCIAAKRFIVHEAIAERFEQAMTAGMLALRVGDPMDRSIQIGPLARTEFVDDLDRQVQESIRLGARLLTGGKRPAMPGSFYPPTVLADVAPDMPAYREETFGPVAAIIRARDIDDAIRIANDSRFGLGASAWTTDAAEQERFVSEIEAGSIFINGMVKSDPRLPFGGIKSSGIGRELSQFGIREFVNVKTVWIA